MGFLIETILGGLMAGMLYAMIAIGFVLIFKASGIFNFAQGAMVLFAALAMARTLELMQRLMPPSMMALAIAAAFAISAGIMIGLAWLVERLVLRHLVNQDGTTLLLATLGIAYVLEGGGQLLFGSSVYKLDVGMPKEPAMVLASAFPGGVLLNLEDLYAAVILLRCLWPPSHCSSGRRRPAGRCARSRMITRRRSQLAFR